jgi:hypothetical protein
VPVAQRPATASTSAQYCSAGEAAGLSLRIAIPLLTNLGQGACMIDTNTAAGSNFLGASVTLQTFAWILGGLCVVAAATVVRRTP